MNKRALHICLLILVSLGGYGQSYVVTKYDVKDGLISNEIEGILFDKDGYLWIENGYALTRYDGSQFQHFKSPEDYGDIVGRVRGIRINEKDEIHYMAMRGKVYFDLKTKEYRHVQADSSALKKYTESGKWTGAIRPCGTQDKFGNVWFKGGPLILQMFDGSKTHHYSLPGLEGNISDYNELIDNEGNYGIQKDNHYYRFNGKDLDYIDIKVKGNYYNKLLLDRQQRRWMFENGSTEIVVFDPRLKRSWPINISGFGKLTGGIAENEDGKIIIACSEGIVISDGRNVSAYLDLKNISKIVQVGKNKLAFYNDNECFVSEGLKVLPLYISDGFSTSDRISEILADKENNLWISSTNGLFKASPSVISFNRLNLEQINGPVGGKVIGFVDTKGSVWFKVESERRSKTWQNNYDWYVRDADGSIRKIEELGEKKNDLSFSENKYGVFINDGDAVWLCSGEHMKKLKERTIEMKWHGHTNIYKDGRDRVWIIFSEHEYVLLEKNEIYSFILSKDTAQSANNTILSEDNDHQIYILSSNKVLKYDEARRDFVPLEDIAYHAGKKCQGLCFPLMCVDGLKQIWLYDQSEGKLICKNGKKEEVFDVTGLGIVGDYNATGKVGIGYMRTDLKGNVWLFSYSNGIFLMEPARNTKPKITHFTVEHGLSANSEDFAGFDTQGNMWMINKLGIDKIDVNGYYATGKLNTQSYSENQGVKVAGYEYLFSNYYKVNNIIVKSGSSGYYNVDLNISVKNEKEPGTYIRYIAWNASGGDNLTGKVDNILYVTDSTEHFELEYDFNPLMIDFIGICLTDGAKVKYKYMLEGLDNNWQEQTEHKVKYSSLPPGDYVFKLMACNNDGVWNKEPVSFSFTVKPPWYRHTGAYLGYVVAFFGILFGFNGVRTKQLKDRQVVLEQTVQTRTSEVVKQKEIIEEKNREVHDSITYAKRIQTAILPSDKIFKAALPDSFVLYKPKDIVSGDFYWLEQINDVVLFAAVDCTGHGVPGAMVSVVGHNGLNRAVHEFGLTQPAAILDKLRILVQDTFKKSEDEVKDGMDISICALNLKTRQLEWAGAYNPLWIFKKGELMETKANKQPIGIYEHATPFTNHKFNLEEGDTVYIFSDGYADQFSPDDKKLMTRKFRDLVRSIQKKNMGEQKEFLGSFIDKWKGNMEQTDDILVIGVRV